MPCHCTPALHLLCRRAPALPSLRSSLGVRQQLHERLDDAAVDDRLDLVARAGGDVGHRPARLLLDALLVVRAQEGQQTRYGAAAEHGLQGVEGEAWA
eukprot:231679-Chlamydomonas_euryale.AAC.1